MTELEQEREAMVASFIFGRTFYIFHLRRLTFPYIFCLDTMQHLSVSLCIVSLYFLRQPDIWLIPQLCSTSPTLETHKRRRCYRWKYKEIQRRYKEIQRRYKDDTKKYKEDTRKYKEDTKKIQRIYKENKRRYRSENFASPLKVVKVVIFGGLWWFGIVSINLNPFLELSDGGGGGECRASLTVIFFSWGTIGGGGEALVWLSVQSSEAFSSSVNNDQYNFSRSGTIFILMRKTIRAATWIKSMVLNQGYTMEEKG